MNVLVINTRHEDKKVLDKNFYKNLFFPNNWEIFANFVIYF